ncbi:hypothetical protein DM02DRAFT_671517 [Periconia macrospinosa]|uniref:Jacalin-type lectin domain-containing protein n=1 Tax=Periconia macrospinosa TaxID=97972 RepID=A0A2V1DV60_9PLEO|nr:hypothetical protein DM02DRAFT_671517 [Periconia macrospinosa]
MIWNHFGGNQGRDLQRIVGLFVKNLYRLESIEFLFDDMSGASSSKLGRCHDYEGAHIHSFFGIDGAGGELITSVAVAVEKSKNLLGEDVEPHRITTNRSRKFSSHHEACYHSDMQALPITPGTTITGFYANQDEWYGLTNLGVISELL